MPTIVWTVLQCTHPSIPLFGKTNISKKLFNIAIIFYNILYFSSLSYFIYFYIYDLESWRFKGQFFWPLNNYIRSYFDNFHTKICKKKVPLQEVIWISEYLNKSCFKTIWPHYIERIFIFFNVNTEIAVPVFQGPMPDTGSLPRKLKSKKKRDLFCFNCNF